jgi:hypothetical protein
VSEEAGHGTCLGGFGGVCCDCTNGPGDEATRSEEDMA